MTRKGNAYVTDLAPISFLPKTGPIKIQAGGWSAVERLGHCGLIIKMSAITTPLRDIGSISLPDTGQSRHDDNIVALWQGVNEWLLLAPQGEIHVDAIREAVRGRTALVADVTS